MQIDIASVKLFLDALRYLLPALVAGVLATVHWVYGIGAIALKIGGAAQLFQDEDEEDDDILLAITAARGKKKKKKQPELEAPAHRPRRSYMAFAFMLVAFSYMAEAAIMVGRSVIFLHGLISYDEIAVPVTSTAIFGLLSMKLLLGKQEHDTEAIHLFVIAGISTSHLSCSRSAR